MDTGSMIGHGLILSFLGWIARTMHMNGIKFEIRIWKNGKHREDD